LKVKMLSGTRDMSAVWMKDDIVKMIDQRYLPGRLEIFKAFTHTEVAMAIDKMIVRGAPAIGIAAAYGMALSAMNGVDVDRAARDLLGTRPTAHDLFHAVNWMKKEIVKGKSPFFSAESYATQIHYRCQQIGIHGETLIPDMTPGKTGILTHCNAGALATGDHGTALAPIRLAHEKGKEMKVFVDETRPRLQGAKLTAWELANEGIPHNLIVDNAAGYYMRRGDIHLCMVGADRIAANGDTANKIGTYEKAVLARENDIPFYVAAPLSTFDFSLENGERIPIEERAEYEVTTLNKIKLTHEKTRALNPAFDVTPSRYITAFITEKGIFEPSRISSLKTETAF